MFEASDGSQCQDSVVSVSGTIMTTGQSRLCSARANAQQTCKKSGLEAEKGIQVPTEGKVLSAKGMVLGLRCALGSCVLHLAHMARLLSVRTRGVAPARPCLPDGQARAYGCGQELQTVRARAGVVPPPAAACRRAPHTPLLNSLTTLSFVVLAR